jgi:hydroxyethylthiazole kinase-like uncharacterized protein yjeF
VIPLATRAEVRAFDRRWIDAGVPGSLLMENAARGAFDALWARWRPRRPLVIGGTGQNGGDAWVLARRLVAHGVTPRVVLAGDRHRVAGDAAVALPALEAVGVSVETVVDGSIDGLDDIDLIVDGLFGTGLDRPVEGWRRGLLEALAAHPAPVVALDLPSGLDADVGSVLGAVLPAQLTVTFAAVKRGLTQMPGRGLAGEVVVADIGVPATGFRDGVVEDGDVLATLPPRALDAHKGTAGHVLVVAGSEGTAGAAVLSALGALRGGAGLATVASRTVVEGAPVEVMQRRLDGTLALAEGKAAAVVGPGLGLDAEGRAEALRWALEAPLPAVLDADALTALAEGPGLEALRDAPAPRVLTPHPGEAGRLLGTSTAAVQADRFAAAEALAEGSGQVAILKGAGTVVASPAGLRVVLAGTPAMGVAGSGDVLAGLCGALLGQTRGADPLAAASASAHLHARAGEAASAGDRGLLASEIAHALPDTLSALRTG